MDVKIGSHWMEEFGLKLLKIEIGTPELQSCEQEIPGRDGTLDLSDALTGFPTFKNVKHKLSFDFKDGGYEKWLSMASSLKGAIHGKRLQVLIGNDTYYYDARICVNTEKLNSDYSKVEIELDAAPYKLALRDSTEDWIWDTFNFETDVIREYKDIQVPSGMFIVIGSDIPTRCAFICSEAMEVVFGTGIMAGERFKLAAGRNENPDFIIYDKAQVLYFLGSGTVSIEYRDKRF